jgi:DNA-binding SARP family transcriptional activator
MRTFWMTEGAAGATEGPVAVRPADATVRMLGPFELALGGVPVRRWTSLKGLTILKYVVMNGGRARREELMDLLWHGYRPQSARNNLNVAIYALRRDLEAAGGASPLPYHDGSYRLSPDLTWRIDLDDFRAALGEAAVARAAGDAAGVTAAHRRAVALYRGPLLEDEAGGEWYLDEQRALQERYLEAKEALAEGFLGAGDVTGAVAVCEDVLRTDPCRESAHRLLMRCFARQHQNQLIARQFRRCAELLDRELGLRPAGETRRLFDQLTGAA